MAQSHHGTVPISDMPSSAQHVKIFHDHAYKPLLSLGQLADAGYKFQGDNNYMILNHPSHQILIATRCPSSGMYLLSLTNPHSAPPSLTFPSTPTLQACSTRFIKDTQYLANNAFSMATKPDLAMYYHHSLFCPVPSTFITAINNGKFSTWPGFTAKLIAKHLPKSLVTAKCHAKLAQKNIRSTRPQDPTPDLPVTSDPPQETVTRTKTIHTTNGRLCVRYRLSTLF